ncbi:hypothetical protein ABPG75_012165 [Micractinium tetrahymenae]
MQWPSRQHAGQQAAQQPQAAQQQTKQAKQEQPSRNRQEVEVEKLWPAEWPPRSAVGPAAAVPRGGSAPPAAQHPARREQQQEPQRPAQQQPAQRQEKAAASAAAATAAGLRSQSVAPAKQQPELDIDALWPASWPARKPAGQAKGIKGASSAAGGSSSNLSGQRAASRGGSRASSPEPPPRPPSEQGARAQRRTTSRSRSPAPPGRQGSGSAGAAAAGKAAGPAGKSKLASGAAFRIPKRAPALAGAAATAPAAALAERGSAGGVLSKHAAASAAALLQQPQAQQAPRQASLSRSSSAASEPLQLLEEDDSLFAGLPPIAGNGGQQGTGRRLPAPRQPAAPAQTARRIVHLAAPPTAALGGRRGGGPAAMPLWQQRRAALGQQRQQAAAAAALLTMDQLLQQLLSWELSAILAGSGGAALQGLQVPVRFSNLQQYTQVFSQLLLEEVRAHLQQAAEENPAAPTLCQRGGQASWQEAVAALGSAGAVPLRLLEVQRQSDLHLLRFEPAAGPAGSAPADSAAEFARSSGIRADDLLLIVSRPAAPTATAPSAAAASAGAAGQQHAPVAVALASVESVHLSQPSDRRPQQGIVGRQRQLLLTMRVSLRGGSSSNAGAGASASRQLLQQQLTPSTHWQAVRLMSLTPHLRQLQALVAAQKLPPLLLAELLDPQASAAGGSSPQQALQLQLSAVQLPLPGPLLRQLQQQYNGSQRSAIAAAATGFRPAASRATPGATGSAGNGVEEQTAPPAQQLQAGQQCVLVQGPPGTGKTAAILGMLSAFLSPNTPKPGKAAGKTAEDSSSKAGKQQAAAAAVAGRQAVVNPTIRVLLAAQSNAAVDELCTRLAARGVIGRDGMQRQVSLVRFGPLEAISPEAAVHHIDAAAAAVEAVDGGLGDTAGQSAQLASRLQLLRQQLRQLQQQIDACDEAVEESRKRRRRRQEREQRQGHEPGGRGRARQRRRREGGSGSSREGSRERGSGASGDESMDLGSLTGSSSGSDSENEDWEEASGAAALTADLGPSSQEVRQQLGPLLQRKQALKKEVAAAAGALRASSAATAARRKELRAAVVAQSEVVAATLSSAGGELLQLMPRANSLGVAGSAAGSSTAPLLGFDAIVCDEAAQALEPSTLIALQLLAPGGRLVLVGDPQQLPATVVSRAAAAASLAQSLFERLMQAGYPLCMLRTQYRMHPAISSWPAAFFYSGRLLDAPTVAATGDGGGGRAAPWHARPCFPPLAFWDCREGRERGGGAGSSVSNAEEAEVAFALYAGLAAQFGRDVGDVAVLTPYKAQLALLRRTFQQRGGAAVADDVLFATVDGFQGREADVVIFSCVRAHANGGSGAGVGFLSDVRRMNVALTRARRSLWIIGHADTLAGCQPWQELMQHGRAQRRLFAAARPYDRLLDARR